MAPTPVTVYTDTATAPTIAASGGTATLQTEAFTPAAGEVLVAWVGTGDSRIAPTTVSGGGLTWTVRGAVTASQYCGLLVATAVVGSSPSSMSVSATLTNNYASTQTFANYYPVLAVQRWTSASLAPTPALSTPTTGSTSTPNSATIDTVGTNSVVTWLDADWVPASGTVAYRSGATQSYQQRNSGASYWLAYQPATSPGSVTIGTTAPTGQKWAMIGIELLDGASPFIAAADTGTRTETATTTASFTAADARAGTDTAAASASFAAADTATSSDSVSAGQLTQAPDSGAAAETVASTGALTAGDPRTGADAAGTRASFTTADTAAGADATTMGPLVADSGTRSETVTTRAAVGVSDARSGADAATVETLFGDLVISLWAVDPATGALSALPDWTQLTLSPERNGPGAISLEYPSDGLNFSILRDTITADRDLEVEIWNLGSNTGSLRGYLQESAGDDVAEDKTTWTFAGGFLELRMGEALVWPQPLVGELTLGANVDVPLGSVTTAQWDRLLSLGYKGTAGDEAEKLTGVPQKVLDAVKANAVSIPVLADPKRELKFNGVTVGELVHFLLNQARARGALTDLATSFNTTTDSAGHPWPTVITTKYSPGTKYDSILNSLASQGRAEWSVTWNNATAKRTLNLYVPVGRGQDRTIGLRPVVLRAGRNMAEAPRKWSVRESATAMLAVGAEGYYADTVSVDAQTRRGRRIEDTTSSQNLATSDAVLAYAQRRLSTKKDGTLEVTHGLSMLPGEPRPLVSFDVGDWVYSQTGPTLDRYRVVGWSLTVSVDRQQSATVTLNDAFVDALTRSRQDLDSLAAGETVAGTSSSTEDHGVPSAPEGLVVGSGAFFDGQDVYALVTAGWQPVTTNTDGGAATDIEGYRVEWARASAPTVWMPAGTAQAAANQLSFTTATALPILVRVLCYDKSGNASAWTTLTAPHTTDDDATPPGVPSTPAGANYLGTVQWTWNGNTVDGADMYAAHPDFAHLELHMSTTSGFTPDDSTRIDTVFGAGTYTYAKTAAGAALVYGATYYAKLVSVDLRGNRSAPSGQASATPGKLVNLDLGPDAVERANIKVAAIGNAQIDTLAVNDGQIMTLGVGKLTAGTLAASMIIGTGSIATGTTGSRVVTDSSGIRLFNSANVVTQQFKTSNGSAMISGEYRTALDSGARMVFNAGGTNPDELRFYPFSTNQYGRIKTLTSNALGFENQAGLTMKAYSGRSDGQSGEASAFPTYASIAWANEMDQGAVTSRVAATSLNCFVGGPKVDISFGSTNYCQIGRAVNNEWIDNTVLRLGPRSGDGNGCIGVWDRHSYIQFDTTFVSVVNDTNFINIGANGFIVSSERKTKTDLQPAPFDPIAALRAVDWYSYRRAYELTPGEPAPTQLGLMVDEMPAEALAYNRDLDAWGIDLAAVVAMLVGAVKEQDAELARVRELVTPQRRMVVAA